VEDEFVVSFETTSQDNWLRNFILGLGIIDISRLEIVNSITRPLKMYYDNSTQKNSIRITSNIKVLNIWSS